MTQTSFNEELDLFDRPSSPAFPLPDANYAYEQFGGGRRYEEPTVELTPSRLRSHLKATARDTGVIKGASI